MRLFKLIRDHDASGVSGTGHVADGVEFDNGYVVIAWKLNLKTSAKSLVTYQSVEDAEKIHGHGGATRIEWNDSVNALLQ